MDDSKIEFIIFVIGMIVLGVACKGIVHLL